MKAHFSLFGIPVRFDPTFLVLVVVFGYLGFLQDAKPHGTQLFVIWIPLVTVAVLLHELGHALTGRAFGLAPFILLHGMGGLTTFPAREHRALSPGRRILITLAGPGAGLVIGVVAYIADAYGGFEAGSLARETLTITWWVTGVWGLLNLVPVLPLDGGHVVAVVLERFFGLAGIGYARVISILVGISIGAWGLLADEWFFAFLAVLLGWQNYRAYRIEKQWQDGGPSAPELKAAYDALSQHDAAGAREIALRVKSRPHSKDAAVKLAHVLAWASLLEDDADGARRHLDEVPSGTRPDAFLAGSVLLAAGDASGAIGPLVEALEDRREDTVADALAEAAERAGRVDEIVALIGSEGRARTTGVAALQRVAHQLFVAEDFAHAGEVYEKLFAHFGDAHDAFNTACAHARRGELEVALGWLSRAVDAGLDDPLILDTDEDLAPLRGRPELAELRARARS